MEITMTVPRMIVINNVRYRREDAYRLGLITDGKAITNRSEDVTGRHSEQAADGGQQVTTNQEQDPNQETPVPVENPADPVQGDSAPAATSPDQTATGPVRPARNASREEWVQYALAQGSTEEDLEGLKRDEISEIFPDPENQ